MLLVTNNSVDQNVEHGGFQATGMTKHDLTHEQGTCGGNRSWPTSTYILYILMFNYHLEGTAENQEKPEMNTAGLRSGIEPRACRIQNTSANRPVPIRVSHVHCHTVFDIPSSDTKLTTVQAALNRIIRLHLCCIPPLEQQTKCTDEAMVYPGNFFGGWGGFNKFS